MENCIENTTKSSNQIKEQATSNRYVKRILMGLCMLVSLFMISTPSLKAQCALCTKTAQQLGDGPAAGLNKGILYLMVIPISILSIIGVKWYKKEKVTRAEEDGQQS